MSDTKNAKIAPQSAAANPQTRNADLDPRELAANAAGRRLDQFYTRDVVARFLYAVCKEHFDPNRYIMVEPSAGTGAFFKLLPVGSRGYDLEPRFTGIERADFLTIEMNISREKVAVIGNPPFGKNASLAVRFFNHAAWQSSWVAFIVPRSFKKASIENRLDPYMHLVREVPVPKDAFLFGSARRDVPAVFQIWERRDTRRALRPVQATHPDFRFVAAAEADFAIQRIGARAGHIHHDLTKSPSSHLFIKSLRGRNVEAIIRQLEFASVKYNTAGCPSIARSEIVALYEKHIQKSVRSGASVTARATASKALSSFERRRSIRAKPRNRRSTS